MSIAELLEGKEVCICAGSGGVGKTTAAAAIAMGMAAQGKKVAVVTIDPAKRLANSLGLEELGNEERRVDPAIFEAAGIEMRGELWAMMLDAKRTFDELIEHHAPDERTRDAVLSNRIYQELSNAVAGSQEYMAMEKLYELHQEERYDLLVLDTPPTPNALDFLDAPDRLSNFIDSRALQLFLKPSRTGLKLISRGTSVAFTILRRVTGVDLLRDLSDFFSSFGDMAQGFSERAARVNELLADRRSTFLLVSSPRSDSIDQAVYFHRRLRERRMPSGGAIVNRMEIMEDTGRADDDLVALLGEELGKKVAANAADYAALAARDLAGVKKLERELNGEPLIVVPRFDEDVHDVSGLARLNEHLFESSVVGRQSSVPKA